MIYSMKKYKKPRNAYTFLDAVLSMGQQGEFRTLRSATTGSALWIPAKGSALWNPQALKSLTKLFIPIYSLLFLTLSAFRLPP